jgi:hypothetical protein
LVKDPPEETLALAQQLEGLRSLTHRGQCVSGRERVVTAWRLGVADRDCAVHFYHPGRRVQTASPSWLHCKAKQFYVILCATDGSPPTILSNYALYRARTHPTGEFVASVSRGFLSLLEVQIYLKAVAYLGTVHRE